MKKFLKYLLFLGILILGTVVAAYFLARKYEPEVKELLVAELNKNLAVPVQVGDINLSLLRRFPNASLRFADVVIPETTPNSEDTLMYIDNLYLQIGLFDFLRKNFTVSEAELNTGFYRMKFHPDGSDNFRFWNSGETNEVETKQNARIKLKNIALIDFEYRLHTAEGLMLDLLVNRAKAEGDFGGEQFTVDAHTDLKINRVEMEGEPMYGDLHLEGPISLQMDVEKGLHAFQISKGKLDGQTVALTGSFDNAGETGIWHLEAQLHDAKVERLVNLIPAELRKEFAAYAAEGRTDMDLTLDFGEAFRLEAGFDNLRGSFRHTVALGKAKVQEGAGVVRIENGKTSLFIDRLEGEIGLGSLTARGEVIDFSAPTFDLNLKGDIDLATLKDFLNITRAEMLKGRVSLDGQLTGHLSRGNSRDDKLKLLRGMDFSGSLHVKDGGFKAVGRSEILDEISGDIELKDNAIFVENAGGTINGSSFRIEGSIGNALPYLSESGQKLHIAANFSAPKLDLNKVWNTENTSSRDTSYHFSLPKDVSFNLVVEVDELEFRKFHAGNVSGKAYYKNGVLSLNPVSFDLASGRVDASLIVSEAGENFRAQAMAAARQLDIARVFTAFENFGQTVIQSENISGRANLDIDFKADFGSDLNVNSETVHSQADLAVSNGKLMHLESLRQIADFIRGNGLWNALIKADALEENLRVVSFDDLKNSIVIADRTVTIPEMKLGNSALTMDVMGVHRFDNTIDYSLNFRLGELLRTGRERSEEFGYVVDDDTGLRLYMRMFGHTDSPEFTLDKDAARDSRRENFQAEKREVKNILKQEFGFFKSDSTLTGIETRAPAPTTKFEVEWGEKEGLPAEDRPPKTQTTTGERNPRKNTSSQPKLSEKDKKLYDELEGDDDL